MMRNSLQAVSCFLTASWQFFYGKMSVWFSVKVQRAILPVFGNRPLFFTRDGVGLKAIAASNIQFSQSAINGIYLKRWP